MNRLETERLIMRLPVRADIDDFSVLWAVDFVPVTGQLHY